MIGATTRQAHIDTVRVGQIVRCPDGLDRTVGVNDLKRGGFMGTTLWGDSYKSGTSAVTIVEPPQPKPRPHAEIHHR
jgi:hypothetical protein